MPFTWKQMLLNRYFLSQLIQSQKDKYDLFSLIFYFLDFTKMNKNMYGCRVWERSEGLGRNERNGHEGLGDKKEGRVKWGGGKHPMYMYTHEVLKIIFEKSIIKYTNKIIQLKIGTELNRVLKTRNTNIWEIVFFKAQHP